MLPIVAFTAHSWYILDRRQVALLSVADGVACAFRRGAPLMDRNHSQSLYFRNKRASYLAYRVLKIGTQRSLTRVSAVFEFESRKAPSVN